MKKHRKIASKILFSAISVILLALLLNNLDFRQIKSSFNVLIGGTSLILYVGLAIISLLARSERFHIIYNISNPNNFASLKILILAGTALRNVSMNFIPLRIGELSLPTIIKLANSEEKFSKSINPLWISILFDMCALFILGTALFLAMEFGFGGDLENSTLQLSFWEMMIFISLTSCLILSLLNFTKLLARLMQSKYLTGLNFTFLNFNFHPAAFAKKVPILNFSLTLRILLLSLIIRISKYLSLTNLFFALSDSLDPNFENVFPIFIAFVSSEIFSSLPGSGVMGFGGYELTFQWMLKLLSPQMACPLSLITTIHLTGFIVEVVLAAIVVPSGILGSKILKKLHK